MTAIDDFGTGSRQLCAAENVNADILKISDVLFGNIKQSLDYWIVASICHLARMKMQVVAEYVESEEIRSVVLSLGIDYLQGYLIGEPQLLPGDSGRRMRRGVRSTIYAAISGGFLPHIETPASYRFPVMPQFFPDQQYQRILAEPVMRKT